MDRNGATVLHFSHVRPLRGRPQLGWGWTATVLRFQMLLVPDLEQSNAHNQFAVLSVPYLRPNRRHSIILVVFFSSKIPGRSAPCSPPSSMASLFWATPHQRACAFATPHHIYAWISIDICCSVERVITRRWNDARGSLGCTSK